MANSLKKIDDDVMDVLKRSEITATTLQLPEQLERKLYEKCNKVITLAGGKWNRGLKAHVFTKDPAWVLGIALESGVIEDKKTKWQQFFTPAAIADKMVRALGITDPTNKSFLEPSAGMGELIAALGHAGVPGVVVNAVEIDPSLISELTKHTVFVVCNDFLTMRPIQAYDYVIMNPPFTNGQDMDHVTHALKFLKPGGTLVAIVSPGYQFHESKKAKAFTSLLEQYNTKEENLPEGAFSSSGTEVRTVMLTIRK